MDEVDREQNDFGIIGINPNNQIQAMSSVYRLQTWENPNFIKFFSTNLILTITNNIYTVTLYSNSFVVTADCWVF